METDFIPLDFSMNSQQTPCNATYLAKNITRQITSKPNITGVLCNISNNQRTTNDIQLQTCVDVFNDIGIEFSCDNFTTFGTFCKLMVYNQKKKQAFEFE